MRHDILLSILFDLLQARRTTAKTLAEKYALSPRTVYRYVEKLSPALPLHILRGRGGGIFLSDDYRLPTRFFTAEEYAALFDALTAAYCASPSDPLLSAKRKLTAAKREEHHASALLPEGSVLFLAAEGEDTLVERLRLLQEGLREKRRLHLLYEGTDDGAFFEPHLLVFEKGEWKTYGFCHARRRFVLLSVASLRGIFLTEESFRPRNFSANDLLSPHTGLH